MLKPNSLKVWISKRIPLCLSNVNNRNAKILLSSEFFDDIAWWVKFMNMFNGTVKFLDLKPITCIPQHFYLSINVPI
jgi:hypothetical protein